MTRSVACSSGACAAHCCLKPEPAAVAPWMSSETNGQLAPQPACWSVALGAHCGARLPRPEPRAAIDRRAPAQGRREWAPGVWRRAGSCAPTPVGRRARRGWSCVSPYLTEARRKKVRETKKTRCTKVLLRAVAGRDSPAGPRDRRVVAADVPAIALCCSTLQQPTRWQHPYLAPPRATQHRNSGPCRTAKGEGNQRRAEQGR